MCFIDIIPVCDCNVCHNKTSILTPVYVFLSVHMRVEEKISLTCGRDGGLQNMELLGMITLRVSDDKVSRIRLMVNNYDKKGVQLQVSCSNPD